MVVLTCLYRPVLLGDNKRLDYHLGLRDYVIDARAADCRVS